MARVPDARGGEIRRLVPDRRLAPFLRQDRRDTDPRWIGEFLTPFAHSERAFSMTYGEKDLAGLDTLLRCEEAAGGRPVMRGMRRASTKRWQTAQTGPVRRRRWPRDAKHAATETAQWKTPRAIRFSAGLKPCPSTAARHRCRSLGASRPPFSRPLTTRGTTRLRLLHKLKRDASESLWTSSTGSEFVFA